MAPHCAHVGVIAHQNQPRKTGRHRRFTIGGIAVAVMLSTAQIAPAVMRATLIALFLFTDLYALACSAVVSFATAAPVELLGTDTLRWALWLAPAMLAGIWVGQRSFVGVAPAQFRRRVLNLLMLIAAISVLRSALDLVS